DEHQQLRGDRAHRDEHRPCDSDRVAPQLVADPGTGPEPAPFTGAAPAGRSSTSGPTAPVFLVLPAGSALPCGAGHLPPLASRLSSRSQDYSPPAGALTARSTPCISSAHARRAPLFAGRFLQAVNGGDT